MSLDEFVALKYPLADILPIFANSLPRPWSPRNTIIDFT